MKFCAHCGKELTSEEKRTEQCASCGEKLSAPTQIDEDERVFFKTDPVSSALMFFGVIGMVFVVILSIAIVNTFAQASILLFGAAAAGGLTLMGIAKCIQYLFEVKQIMIKSDDPNPIPQSEEKTVLKKDGLSVAFTLLGVVGMLLVIAFTLGSANDLGPFTFVFFGAAVSGGLTLIGIARCVQYLYEIRQLTLEKAGHQADKNGKDILK